MILRKTLAAIALGATALLPIAASAQQLEEIVVTAQRREQSLQDIGISITAFTAAEIEKLGITNATQITEFVPNVELGQTGDSSTPIFVIRGVGLQDYNTNNTPTTATYVDDVYMPYNIMTNFVLLDAERVEILKGPQGGLYGRNTTGGAINFASRTPSFEETQANVAVDVGDYGAVNLRGGVSMPFGETFAARVAVQYDSSDGFWNNTFLNTDQGAIDKTQARLTLSWKPTDAFQADLRVVSSKDESEIGLPDIFATLDPTVFSTDAELAAAFGIPAPFLGIDMNQPLTPELTPAFCPAMVNTGLPSPDCINMMRFTDDGDPFTGSDDIIYKFDDSFDLISLHLDWDFGPVSLVSITATIDNEIAHPQADAMAQTSIPNQVDWELTGAALERFNDGAMDPGVIQDYRSKVEAWSQEFRLLSNRDGNFSWMLGAVYAEDDFTEDRFTTFPGNLYWDWTAFPGGGDMDYFQTTEAWSVYAQGVFEFADAWRLTVDARYTDEQKTYDGVLVINDGPWTCALFGIDATTCDVITGPNGEFPFSGANTTYDEAEPSGKVNLDWIVSDDVLIYGSVARGFKSGGFFGGFMTDPQQVTAYKPETNTALELGFKSTLAGGTVQLNGAVFRYDYKDWQANLTTLDAQGAGFAGLANIGDVKVTGAELDLNWLPMEGLNLRLSLGALDTEVDKVNFTDFEDPGAGITVGIFDIFDQPIDITGNQINYAPEFSANALGRYDFAVGATMGMAFQVDASYTGEHYVGITNEPYQKVDGFGLVNARVELYGDAGWNIAAWGRNLTDEVYTTAIPGDGLFNFWRYWSPPRTVGVTLSYSFN